MTVVDFPFSNLWYLQGSRHLPIVEAGVTHDLRIQRREIQFLLAPSDEKPSRRIADDEEPVGGSLGVLRPRGELPVVLEQEVAQQDLDLVGSEEAPGTGVVAVAEPEVLGRRADQLAVVLPPGRPPHPQEPRPVEPRRVRPVVRRVPHVRRVRDHVLALADHRPVR